jgi:hypothetical protein
MYFAFFHGEGIFFSFLIHSFVFLVGIGVLIFGLRKFKSKIGEYVVMAYAGLVLIAGLIYQQSSNLVIESITSMLTLPWSLILPCYNMDHSCSLSFGMISSSASLNAAIIYLLTAIISRRKHD